MWQRNCCTAFVVLAFCCSIIYGDLIIPQDELEDAVSELYTIEGKVFPPEPHNLFEDNSKWQTLTTLSINSGEYKGFLRADGSFTMSGMPSGSYVLEVNHPDYIYESMRVEINNKGKFRARKLNYLQPAQVIQMPYPLKLKALARFKYFQQREQWKITEFLFNPMVLMMALPLILLVLLPKLISDPETKKEIENIQFPKMSAEMPEISEVISSLFTGGSKQPEKEKKPISSKQNKKRN